MFVILFNVVKKGDVYVLETLESANVFKYFEQISSIPRESENEKLVSNYLVDFARENNLWYKRDEYNNVLIRKSASIGYENAPTIILQAHMDMVCVKTNESSHDFSEDPIKLIMDGKILCARDTSLGADDGIGVAIILAILESENIVHPKIEAVFTVDEENTMLGAEKFDKRLLEGKILFNLDGEEENCFVSGSCGAINTDIIYDVKFVENENPVYQIKIDGLLGGHSAIAIANEQGNAIILMARILSAIRDKMNFGLAEIYAGEKTNVIPSLCISEIILNEKDFDIAKKIILDIGNDFKNEFKTSEPNLSVKFIQSSKKFASVVDDISLKKLIDSILIMPNGVINRNLKLGGITETSNNIGKIRLENEKIVIGARIRSSLDSRLRFVFSQLYSIAKFFDGTAEILNIFPAWAYNPDSKLIHFCTEVYKKLYDKSPDIKATHGGLEASYFSQISGMDIISLGPNIYNIHSVNEFVEIDSVDRFWRFLKEVMKNMNSY